MNIFRKLGPGLLFAGAAIGVSHLVQSTRAGADFGLGWVWALVLVNLFKYPFFQYGPRYAMATGESLLEGYKRLGKGVLVIYFVLTLATMFTIQSAVTIVTAGLAVELFGITNNAVYWSLGLTAACSLLLVVGRYATLDRLMKIIIVTLSISTLIAVILATQNTQMPSWQPTFPVTEAGLAFLIAFMGWMPGPLDISVWHSLWTLEKKKSVKGFNIKNSLFDFNVGFATTFFLGGCFLLLGAYVMFGSGTRFSNSGSVFAGQLIDLYTSSLGQGAYWVIGIAALTTMFSTTLTCLDASPRAMAKTARLMRLPDFLSSYALWLAILAVGTSCIFLFFLADMGLLVAIATILSFITAPFYAIANFVLIKGKHTPEMHRPKAFLKALSWAGIAFLIGFSLWYLTTL